MSPLNLDDLDDEEDEEEEDDDEDDEEEEPIEAACDSDIEELLDDINKPQVLIQALDIQDDFKSVTPI